VHERAERVAGEVAQTLAATAARHAA